MKRQNGWHIVRNGTYLKAFYPHSLLTLWHEQQKNRSDYHGWMGIGLRS
jgi:hypothetical protein